MDFTLFILACPAVGFLLLALAGMRMSHRAAGLTGTLLMAVTTVLSGATAWRFFTAARNADGVLPVQIPFNVEWLPLGGSLHIDMGMLLDPISVMMLVVVSGVSLMVHIYSLGYMKGERGFQQIGRAHV